jgi:hypothetical protein
VLVTIGWEERAPSPPVITLTLARPDNYLPNLTYVTTIGRYLDLWDELYRTF